MNYTLKELMHPYRTQHERTCEVKPMNKESLTRRARKHFPTNPKMAAKLAWAMRYVRRKGIWVADPDSPTPSWGLPQPEQQ